MGTATIAARPVLELKHRTSPEYRRLRGWELSGPLAVGPHNDLTVLLGKSPALRVWQDVQDRLGRPAKLDAQRA